GQVPARRRMEEAAQREVQPRMRCAVVEERPVAELGPARMAVQALEEPYEVRTVRAVDRGPVVAVDGRPRTRDRQLGIDARDMEDRLGLEVEHRRVLAQVGDLQDAAAATVVDQEGLVALATEVAGDAAKPEELGGDRR